MAVQLLVHEEVAEPARGQDGHALADRPGLDGLPDGPAELVAALRCRLVRRVVRVEQHRHDGHHPVAHEPLVHEAPGVTEGTVARLHADVGHVEVEVSRERLDQVPAEGRIHREGPVPAVPVQAPVREPAKGRHALDRRREVLDGLAPVDAERGLVVRAEPLVLVVADHDDHVRGLLGHDPGQVPDGRLGRVVAGPGHLGLELAADPGGALARPGRELGQARPVQIAEPRERLVGCAQHRAVRGADAEGDLCHAAPPSPAASRAARCARESAPGDAKSRGPGASEGVPAMRLTASGAADSIVAVGRSGPTIHGR